MSVLSVAWRWERWGEPTKTADRGWNGPLYGLVSRIPPVHAKKQDAKPDRLLESRRQRVLKDRTIECGVGQVSPNEEVVMFLDA